MSNVLANVGKASGGALLAFCGAAGGQFYYFEKTYEPLPTPQGVMEGIEIPTAARQYASARAPTATASPSLASPSRESSWWWSWRRAGSGASDAGGTSGAHSPKAKTEKTTTVLFLGDSLIAGVGCMNNQAVLPRRIAK